MNAPNVPKWKRLEATAKEKRRVEAASLDLKAELTGVDVVFVREGSGSDCSVNTFAIVVHGVAYVIHAGRVVETVSRRQFVEKSNLSGFERERSFNLEIGSSMGRARVMTTHILRKHHRG